MGACGACAGMTQTLGPALWSEVYGVRHIGAVRAVTTAAMVLASAGSPILFGWLLDRGWSVTAIAWLSAAYVGAGIALSAAAARAYGARNTGAGAPGVA